MNVVHWYRWEGISVPPILNLIAGLVALVAALGSLGPVRAGVEPMLTLTPDRGFCLDPHQPIVARGAHFPPGLRIILHVRRDNSHMGILSADTTVAADGTFVIQTPLQCDPREPAGTRYLVMVDEVDIIGQKPITRGKILAQATFIVSSSPQLLPGMPTTGEGGTQVQASSFILPLAAGALLVVLSCLILGYRWSRWAR